MLAVVTLGLARDRASRAVHQPRLDVVRRRACRSSCSPAPLCRSPSRSARSPTTATTTAHAEATPPAEAIRHHRSRSPPRPPSPAGSRHPASCCSPSCCRRHRSRRSSRCRATLGAPPLFARSGCRHPRRDRRHGVVRRRRVGDGVRHRDEHRRIRRRPGRRSPASSRRATTGDFDLTRLVITHCVIDAQPAGVPITACRSGARDRASGSASPARSRRPPTAGSRSRPTRSRRSPSRRIRMSTDHDRTAHGARRPEPPARAGSSRRRFAIVVGVLAVVGLAGAAANVAQGPRVTAVQVDPAAAVAASGSRLIVTTTQSLAEVDPSQVTVTPATPFTVDTSGRSVGVRFALPLWDDTDYTVTIDGRAGARRRPDDDASPRRSAPPPRQCHLLQRSADGDDAIFRTDLTGENAVAGVHRTRTSRTSAPPRPISSSRCAPTTTGPSSSSPTSTAAIARELPAARRRLHLAAAERRSRRARSATPSRMPTSAHPAGSRARSSPRRSKTPPPSRHR